MLLDIRPEWERSKARFTESIHVPLFVNDPDIGLVILWKKWVHFRTNSFLSISILPTVNSKSSEGALQHRRSFYWIYLHLKKEIDRFRFSCSPSSEGAEQHRRRRRDRREPQPSFCGEVYRGCARDRGCSPSSEGIELAIAEFELRKHQHSRLKKQGSQLEAQAQAFVSVSPKGIHRLREAPEAVKLISKQVAAGHTSPSLLHLREL
ncbi:Rhodanese-like domain-containing protein 10 [Linum perenne]